VPAIPIPLIVIALIAMIGQARSADVLTQHNDNARSGVNAAETILTPAVVNGSSFGKLFTLPLNASVNGQVLYVHDVPIGDHARNAIFAYTSTGANGSPCGLYAFDADNEGPPLWTHILPPSAEATTCTPAIDAGTRTMYVVSKEKNNSGPSWLHAVDITSGEERSGSPIRIEGSVEGKGAGSVDGRLVFNSREANCRPGVLVEKGLIYFAFARAGDQHPYHGWVFCYGYDGHEFTRKAVFCTTPDPDEGKPSNFSKDSGGIWQAGKGLACDGDAVYCTTGNGNFNADVGGRNYGMCFLKLRTGDLQVLDWFAHAKAHKDSDDDNDLGNCGPVIIPGTSVLFAGATKYGRSYLVDTAHMGHFNPDQDACLQSLATPTLPFPNGQNGVAWNAGTAGTFIYVWNRPQPVAQFAYDPQLRRITDAAPQHLGTTINGNGGGLSITANGTHDGILWCLGTDAVIHAVDAADISKELWSSAANAPRDALGSVGHWQFPTIAGGKAYMPTGDGKVVVYGLLNHQP
jgi:hypothetical protein